jgi:tetratricopeptide (TPR) repeat protein
LVNNLSEGLREKAEALQESGDPVEWRKLLSEAKYLQIRALDGRMSVLGEGHGDTLTSVFNLAQVLHALKEYSEALEFYEKALTGLEENLGPDHPTTEACRNKKALLTHTPEAHNNV